MAKFEDTCTVTTVERPTVPVIDDCGPGNARFGTVPSGPWTSVLNPDGSLTSTANSGYAFPDGKTGYTLPRSASCGQQPRRSTSAVAPVTC